jgi:hypothetical protein
MIGKLTCHRKKEKLFSTFVTKTKAYKGKNLPRLQAVLNIRVTQIMFFTLDIGTEKITSTIQC